jgi:ferredoxin-NADP reductase
VESDEFAQRWLATDHGRQWDVATVVAVCPEGTDATTLRLQLPVPANFVAGQYYLVRLRVGTAPKVVEQAYSVSSSPWPPSSQIEITVRDVPRGRLSPVLARQIVAGDQLHLRGPFGSLTWNEADGDALVMIGAGSGVAPFTSIVRFASARRSKVPMALLCSSRERASVLFGEQLEELSRRENWLSVVHTLTRSPSDPWARYHRRIDASMIDEVIGGLGLRDRTSLSLLFAGPPEMVTSVRRMVATLGIAEHRIDSEIHA